MRREEFCQRITAALTEERIRSQVFPDYFRGAVLVPVIYRNGELSVVFEVRSRNLVWQPGEICFPGGRLEERDESPEAAAIRETGEELGIDKNHIQMLGAMDPILSPLGLILYPSVGYLREWVQFLPNPEEVAEIFMVPLKYLLSAVPQVGHMEMGTRPMADFPAHLLEDYPADWKKRKTYRVLFYQYREYVIWGLTAQVLHQFLTVCKEL